MEGRNYQQITDQATKQIINLMKEAKENPEEAFLLRQWAYGVYLLWERLTFDMRTLEDEQRMWSLAISYMRSTH